jgi:hypothetical protein
VALAGGCYGQLRRQVLAAGVSRVRRASNAVIAGFDLAIGCAPVAVDVVAIVTGQREAESVSAVFSTTLEGSIEGVFGSTLSARVARCA